MVRANRVKRQAAHNERHGRNDVAQCQHANLRSAIRAGIKQHTGEDEARSSPGQVATRSGAKATDEPCINILHNRTLPHRGSTSEASRFNNDPANCRRLYLSNISRNRAKMPCCRALSALRM